MIRSIDTSGVFFTILEKSGSGRVIPDRLTRQRFSASLTYVSRDPLLGELISGIAFLGIGRASLARKPRPSLSAPPTAEVDQAHQPASLPHRSVARVPYSR